MRLVIADIIRVLNSIACAGLRRGTHPLNRFYNILKIKSCYLSSLALLIASILTKARGKASLKPRHCRLKSPSPPPRLDFSKLSNPPPPHYSVVCSFLLRARFKLSFPLPISQLIWRLWSFTALKRQDRLPQHVHLSKGGGSAELNFQPGILNFNSAVSTILSYKHMLLILRLHGAVALCQSPDVRSIRDATSCADHLSFNNPLYCKADVEVLETTVFKPKLVYVHVLDAMIGNWSGCSCSAMFKTLHTRSRQTCHIIQGKFCL